MNATVAAASAPRLPRAESPHEREAPDRLDDRALLALGLGGKPRGRRAAALALEAHGLEAWARLPVIDCLAEAHRLLDAEDAARLAALLELARRALGPPPGLELSRPEDVVSLLHEWRHETR